MHIVYINHHRSELTTADLDAEFLPTCRRYLSVITLGGVERLRLHLVSLRKEETG